MDYQEVTVWTVIKRFVIGWLIAGLVLVIVSCVKYKEYILAVFAANVWAWINLLLPIAIMLFGIRYMLKAVFN